MNTSLKNQRAREYQLFKMESKIKLFAQVYITQRNISGNATFRKDRKTQLTRADR